MKKKITKRILILIIAVIMITLAGCQSKGTVGETATKINVGYLRVPNDEMVAKTTGIFDKYFTEKGIECNFIVFDSGVDANKALASGDIDFATMGDTNGIIAFSRGLDVELVWIHEVLGKIEALAVKNDLNISRAADLKGKVIATPFASTSHYSLLNYLKDEGIQDEVQLMDMQTSDIVAAWERDDIQAAYTWQPTLGQLLKNGTVLVSSEEMANKGYVTANVCLVNKTFSDQNSELVADFIKCLSEGGDAYRSNPEQSAAAVAKELGISTEEALAQMEGSKWLTPEEELSSEYMGTPGSPGDFAKIMKDTADFLQLQKSIDVVPSQEEFDQFINSEYLELSLKK